MGNSDKNEETRRSSFSDSAHKDAPKASTVKGDCSEKNRNLDNYIRQRFDVVPNGVTLDDAEIILIGETHSLDPDIRLQQMKTRNTIVSNLASPKDTLLFEGMEQDVRVKIGETDPDSSKIVKDLCTFYKPTVDKGVLITGWDNIKEQAILKSSWRERDRLIEEHGALLKIQQQILDEKYKPENESKKAQMDEEFDRLSKRAEEIRSEAGLCKQRIRDSFINRNQSMIQSIAKFSAKDNRVFILTGQSHFDFTDPRNDELKAALSGKKVLYLLEKKREGEEGHAEAYAKKVFGTD